MFVLLYQVGENQNPEPFLSPAGGTRDGGFGTLRVPVDKEGKNIGHKEARKKPGRCTASEGVPVACGRTGDGGGIHRSRGLHPLSDNGKGVGGIRRSNNDKRIRGHAGPHA